MDNATATQILNELQRISKALEDIALFLGAVQMGKVTLNVQEKKERQVG